MEKIKNYCSDLLMNSMRKKLPFHNIVYTQEVVNNVKLLSEKLSVLQTNRDLPEIAAWFHDTGFRETYKGHEEASKTIAAKFLSNERYDSDAVKLICSCINATKMPQDPDNEYAEILCDADLQTTPIDFNLLLEFIEEYDLVTGMRSNRKNSFVKNMSSKIANGTRGAFTHDGMDDTGCPLKIIKTDCAKRIPMFKRLHRFLPAMILLQGGKIKQVPVDHFPRIAGKAKFGLWNRL